MNNFDNHEILESIRKLDRWVEQSGWKAYDTFDGLSSPLAPILTAGNPLLKQIWQQGIRRFPINLRPILLIRPGMSSKAMGFFTQGYLGLFRGDGDARHLKHARFCLDWLMNNRSAGFKGYCWGNHFDYQSRGGNIPRECPTIVWTGLIGHAFLDAFESLNDERYLDVAISSCDFILDELGWMEKGEGVCLRYYPNSSNDIHNSNMIGASLLARVNQLRSQPRYLEMAERAVIFTVEHQRENGGWYYGVADRWHWVDSFHSGYVLESLERFRQYSGLTRFDRALEKGYRHFVETFFGEDGTPRYYEEKMRPLDIQCASQGIQTLVNLRRLHPKSIEIARKVASWTIANMQDATGYFYYRKYPLITNKTPTLHWGQATMFAALVLLNQVMTTESSEARTVESVC